ncbi:hypothetical protein PIB30_037399 [Stylosanthes scabra]|uniref:Protein CHUP1, chloroplastic n=1 Tax=Stylosanthes scabra TaxID=79078 RepID=A0ABU6XDV2_9FABA|nr:hypothetical protein [Stylosanthes scabra]
MIIRVSFLLVASSFALLRISAAKSNFPRKRMKSLAPGCDELEETENSTANAAYLMNQNEEKHMKNEKKILQNLEENYKQREMSLQRKLLQLNVLKEEQSAIAELQIQLNKKNVKFDSLHATIGSLEAENKIMEEKVREDAGTKKHLEIAKKMLNEMERKKSFEGRQVEEQILMLEQQVTDLQKQDSSARDAKMVKKLKDVEGVKLEALELKRRNKELELEKREIGFKLVTADSKVNTQEETVALIKEEITGLRRVHEELLEQVERLQRNQFEMVEEVVYQRWLFACLRFELNNHHQKKVTRERNCIKNNLEESYNQNDQNALTYEYNDPELESNNSSNTTTFDDDDETQAETETTTLDESFSSSQSSSSKSSTKRWKKTKHYYSKENNVISSPAMQKSLKRVSFGDCSVKPCNNQDVSKADEKVTDNKEIRDFLENKQENKTEDKQELDRDFLKNKKENRTEHKQELDAVVNKFYSQGDCWKDFTIEKEIRLEDGTKGCDEVMGSNKSLVGKKEGTNNNLIALVDPYEMVTRQELRAKLVGLVQLVTIIFFSLVLLQAYFRIGI